MSSSCLPSSYCCKPFGSRAYTHRTVTASAVMHRPGTATLHSSWSGSCHQVQQWPIELSRKRATTRNTGRGHRLVTRMGKTAANGIFTPLVVLVRNQLGTKQFNQLRGKGISLHSQVIKEFGKNIGAEQKQVQGLIRLAKQNGEKLGFLS